MAGSYPTQLNLGTLLATTSIFDVQRLQEVDVKSPEFKELLVRLYQNVNNIVLALNIKDAGYYDLQEFLNGQLYFPNPSLDSTTASSPVYRQVFRTVVNFGTLPNAGATSVNHNIPITTGYSFTRIYATATNATLTSFIPIPYVHLTLSHSIQLDVNATQVTITTGIDQTAYTTCYVILEYIKQ